MENLAYNRWRSHATRGMVISGEHRKQKIVGKIIMNTPGSLRWHFLYSTMAAVIGLAVALSWSTSSWAMHREQHIFSIVDFGAVPNDEQLDTESVQKAIDKAAEVQGTVRIPAGRFILGNVQLRSGIRLVFEEGAVIQGSSDWRHYGQGRWTDSLFLGEDITNLRIEGPGTIDGADCERPGGEEGFRGPHGIRLVRSSGVVINDVTIKRAGNYAIICWECRDVQVKGVTFRGGHDGVHAQACQNFVIEACDFRTGDDCIAGCDNEHFVIRNCQINSSCNGFRLGCVHLLVENCRFWGPGEYPHRITVRQGKPRTNMLSAFVHFAPTDRNPKLPSDDWLVRNCTMTNVDRVYSYDFEKGVWQTGQPAKRLVFENIQAEGIAFPLNILGDKDRQFDLTLRNVAISLRPASAQQPVIQARQFGKITLERVVLKNDGSQPVLRAREGNELILQNVAYPPECSQPFLLEDIVRIDRRR